MEYKFALYVQTLKKKGFFIGVTYGTPAYEQRFTRARQKFIEKYPAPATTTQTPKEETIKPEDISLAEQYKTEGNQHLADKKYEQAVECYRKAIELNPNNAIYFANRAAANSHMGKHQLAIDDCKQSLKLNPQYSKAYGRLGLAYFSLGMYKEAVEQYSKGVELEPNNASLKESLLAAQRKLQTSGNQNVVDKGSATGSGGDPFANIFNPDMLNSIGRMFGGGQGTSSSQTGTPQTPPPNIGNLDLNNILNNPMFQNMAQQLMNNPQMMNMANNMMSNPEAMNNLSSLFGGQLPDQPPSPRNNKPQ